MTYPQIIRPTLEALYRLGINICDEIEKFHSDVVLGLAHSGWMPIVVAQALLVELNETPFPRSSRTNIGLEKKAIYHRRYRKSPPVFAASNAAIDRAAHTPEFAWQIVLAYARRWQIEMAVRYHKSELSFERPRLIQGHARHKLLLIAALAYSYFLSFLPLQPGSLPHWLLQHFYLRTGKRSRDAPTPLYRLRLALSLFWFSHPPPFLSSL